MHLLCGQLRIVLILALLQEFSVRTQKDIFKKQFTEDSLDCPECFIQQRWQCENFFNAIEEPSELSRLWKGITLLLDRREIYWLELNGSYKNKKCLSKRKSIQNGVGRSTTDLRDFQWNPGGFQLCSSNSRFVDYLVHRGYLESTIWYYIGHSITPLLMPELWSHDFSVPQSLAVCGLTHFQAYAGLTLRHYLGAAIDLRLEMARQLLRLALKLTKGFEGFVIYLTDFTVDNFAYDEASKRLVLIDVDTIVLVDMDEGINNDQMISKYEPLPGEGFTYDVNAFCTKQHLDANIYQACLLLRDELLLDVDNASLQQMLDECVKCEDVKCDMRFQSARDVIDLIDNLV